MHKIGGVVVPGGVTAGERVRRGRFQRVASSVLNGPTPGRRHSGQEYKGPYRHARRVLRRPGRVVPIVAKLEKAEAIANLDAIIAEADAVIVARGRTTFCQLHRVGRGA